MENGINLLRVALTPYTVEAVTRRADKTEVVTVSYQATQVTRVLKQADLQDHAKLAEHVNDFKRDMAGVRHDADRERVELMKRLGSRCLASFNPELHSVEKKTK